MAYTIMSAQFANADGTSAIIVTTEVGAVAASARDTPALWTQMLAWGTPAAYVELVHAISLPVLQQRLEAETVAATDGWTAYVNYMFGAAGRRNAFMKVMFIGRAILADDTGFRNTLTGAGFATDQIARVLA